ncbi:serine protease [Pedobacter sp. FW305-3-2-15-E-R2A2]|uniref:trypsin-like serine peptidase n=1 Tax=Pedobacter sp. FW305-3-2-15-E-R2A2 TaxID=3140251 RepID=UPI0031405474
MNKPLILFVFMLLGCNLKITAQTDSSRVRTEMIERAFEKYKNYQTDKRSTRKMTADRVRSSDQKTVIGSDYESAEAVGLVKAAITAIIVDPFEGLPAKRRVLVGATQYDSRIEARNVDPKTAFGKTALINSVSVGIVIDKDKLHQISRDEYQLDFSSTLGTTYNLCQSEPFINQPVLGSGTAFVVGKDRLITAGHVFQGDLSRYAIVFGFELTNASGGIQAIISADSVYFPKKITRKSEELDLKEFTVDRELKQLPLKLGLTDPVKKGNGVYMIGHPYGLPKKVAANAGVEKDEERDIFYTSLDAFQGNSGSPVFDVVTHRVIGVLVGGQVDFQWQGNCNISTLCKMPYCQGEKAVRISSVADWFP